MHMQRRCILRTTYKNFPFYPNVTQKYQCPKFHHKRLRRSLFNQQIFTGHAILCEITDLGTTTFFILPVRSNKSHKDKLAGTHCHCVSNTLCWLPDALTQLLVCEKKIPLQLSSPTEQNWATISVPLPAHLLTLCPSRNNKRLKAQKVVPSHLYSLDYFIHFRC